jgi:hypothetical protein
MPTVYWQTIRVQVWKEHVCACCGCRFRYLFQRTKKGQGGNPDQAAANAERAVVKALAHEVDLQPCPGCGLYQPDMVAARRAPLHWIIAGVGLVLLALFWILTACDVLSLAASAWACAVVAALVVLAHLAVALLNPNWNPEANRQLGQQRVQDRTLWTPPNTPINPNGVPPPTGLTWVGWALFAMMALCVLGAMLPELLRGVGGWPTNKDWSPPVVGPGDATYIYLPDKVSGVNGYWRGSAQVWATADDPGIVALPLRATSNEDNWGMSINVEGSGTPTGNKTL